MSWVLLLSIVFATLLSKSARGTMRGFASTKSALLDVPSASVAEGIDKGSASNPWPGDADCVSVFPDFCRFVDELPIPNEIDISNGEVLILGAYNIQQRIHRDLPLSSMYGYGTSPETASTPGPTLRATRRIVSKVKWENHLMDENFTLPTEFIGYATNGSIPTSVHVHGGETEPQSDGHPNAWFTKYGETGPTYVSNFANYHNGQPASTLWYHDHTIGLTAHNVYMGLAGLYIVDDPGKQSFELPAKEFDIPLVIQYRYVDEMGVLQEPNDDEYHTGSLMVVNGKAWPYYNVQRTTYRFRLLNAANLYVLNVSLLVVNETQKNASAGGVNFIVPNGTFLDVHQIASDGGFLSKPVKLDSIAMGPAERVEILVDFSSIPGDGPHEIYLINKADILNLDLGASSVVAKFIVSRDSKEVASPPLPAVMNCDLPMPSTARAIRTRWITLTEMEAADDVIHLLGMHLFTDSPTEIVKEGSTEVWALINLTPQAHTIHLHATKFQLISRQTFSMELYSAGSCSFLEPETKGSCYVEDVRSPVPGSEQGWKDTLLIQEYEVAMITFSLLSQDGEKFPFDPTASPGYVWHCHFTEHEDFVMMRPFVIERSHTDEIYDDILLNNDYPDLSLVPTSYNTTK